MLLKVQSTLKCKQSESVEKGVSHMSLFLVSGVEEPEYCHTS